MSVNLDLTFMPWGALAAGLLTGNYNDDPKAGSRLTDHGWGGLEEHRPAVAREVAAVAQEIGASSRTTWAPST